MTILLLARQLLKDISKGSAGLILSATAVLIVFGTFGSYLAEHQTNTQFKSLWDSLWWVIVTMSTVGYGDKVPITAVGRLVGVVCMVGGPLLLVSAVGSVGVSLYKEWSKGIKGMAQVNSKGHVVICGWSERTKEIISEIHQCAETRHLLITVVDDHIESRPVDDPKVSFVHGNASEVSVIKRANIAQAQFAIVLAENSTPAADQKTVLTVLTIKKTNPSVITAAELNDANNEEHLNLVGCDVVVIGSMISSRLLAMSLQNPSVNTIVKELVSQYGNEIFRLPVPDKYIGHNFSDVMGQIKSSKSAIAIGAEREGKVSVNPPADFVFKPGDFVMVIAEEQPSL